MSPYFAQVDVRYGCCVAFGGLLFFQAINMFISYLGPPRTLKNSEDEFWKYKNVFISWIHACVAGPWTLACGVFIHEYWRDSIQYVEFYGYTLLAISTGYFIYDCIDCIISKKVLKMWEVCLHHVGVISVFVYNLVQIQFIGYTIYALLTEVNSIFLHARKLMQMAKVDFNHPFYRLNNVFNIITFTFFRFGALVIITVGMAMPQERRKIAIYGSYSYYAILSGSMAIMWAINPILCWRLIKNDFLRKKVYTNKQDHSVHANGLNGSAKKGH